MKLNTLAPILAGCVLILMAGTTSAETFGIPEKSWAVIGYESVNSNDGSSSSSSAKKASRPVNRPVTPKPKRPTTAVAAKKKPVKKVVPRNSSPSTGNRAAPSQGAKAAVGVGAAAAAAALGTALLSTTDSSRRPLNALVEATKKPVVVVAAPRGDKNSDGASIPSEIFNLVKAIVGVGVLSLPAGVAGFGTSPSAIIPAIALISIIGLLSALSLIHI